MGTLLTTSPALPPPGARLEPPSHPCPGLLQGPHSFQHGRTHALPTACSPHTGHDPLKANSCSEPSLAPHLTRAAAGRAAPRHHSAAAPTQAPRHLGALRAPSHLPFPPCGMLLPTNVRVCAHSFHIGLGSQITFLGTWPSPIALLKTGPIIQRCIVPISFFIWCLSSPLDEPHKAKVLSVFYLGLSSIQNNPQHTVGIQ